MSRKNQKLNEMIVINTIASICCENMLAYLSADIIYSDMQTVFQELLKEQIMFKNNYPSILSRQMAVIGFVILEIFFATHPLSK